MSDDRIVMVCMPRAQMPVAPIPSDLERCEICSAEVWVDSTVAHDACVCLSCAISTGQIPVTWHPGVEATLRHIGFTAEQIESMGRDVERWFAEHRRH